MGTINVAWWNLENLFDTDDDPISSDFEFTTANGWTPELFQAKKENLAKALDATFGGVGPELLGVAEVEGDDVFEQLVGLTANTHLKVVKDPTGTRDLRGIDVSIAYDDRKLKVIEKNSYIVHFRYPTRDIFEVVFEVKDTQERFVVIASHWPSRRVGREHSEPLRIAVAENIAYLVRNRVRFDPEEYLQRKAANDLAAVKERWETPVLLFGDFNDEPFDVAVTDHLQGSSELDRVIGITNAVAKFENEPSTYTGGNIFLYAASWKFLPGENTGSFYMASTPSGEVFANRYQVLDQMLASRGMLKPVGLRLDVGTVRIFDDPIVATGSGRPRAFDWKTKKGTSDHLPVLAELSY